eukprot:2821887-Amphidinium_carterae.2
MPWLSGKAAPAISNALGRRVPSVACLACRARTRSFSSPGADNNVDLDKSVAWVVGGAGVIGSGICRGLLRAGATVILSSRKPEKLASIEKHLGYPTNLITLEGTMLPEGIDALLQRALGHPELNGRLIKHVVAHNGVRWWATGGAQEAKHCQ